MSDLTTIPVAGLSPAGIRVAARLPRVAYAGLALLALVGLYQSLHACFGLWKLDSDMANPVMVWQGLHEFGPVFLRTWHYTADNWLLTLFPLHFLAYAAIGPSPTFILLSGWLIFVGCVALAFLITRRVAATAPAAILAVALLFAQAKLLGWPGFLVYPATHNISLLFGLAGLWCAAGAVRGGGAWRIGAAYVLLAADAVSDPWTTPAFLLPIGIAAAALLARDWCIPGLRLRAAGLIATAVLAWLTAATRLFHLLLFLPPMVFERADAPRMMENARLLAGVVASVVSFVPGFDPESPALVPVNLGLLLLLLARAAWLLLPRLLRMEAALAFVLLVAALSTAGTASAFLVSTIPPGVYIARFLLNGYVFAALLVVVAEWLRWREGTRIAKLPALACAALFMAVGVLGNVPTGWTRLLPRPDLRRIPELVAFMREHGLTYGYGPYFGIQANAVTWLSGGTVRIRPILFRPDGTIVASQAQSSPLWYRPEDVPPGQRRFFVIAARDLDQCAQIEPCVEAALRRFGPADETLDLVDAPYGTAKVLVWNHPVAIPWEP